MTTSQWMHSNAESKTCARTSSCTFRLHYSYSLLGTFEQHIAVQPVCCRLIVKCCKHIAATSIIYAHKIRKYQCFLFAANINSHRIIVSCIDVITTTDWQQHDAALWESSARFHNVHQMTANCHYKYSPLLADGAICEDACIETMQ